MPALQGWVSVPNITAVFAGAGAAMDVTRERNESKCGASWGLLLGKADEMSGDSSTGAGKAE